MQVLREEKADMESRFDREVGELEDQQTQELDELAKSYKNKMAAEIERCVISVPYRLPWRCFPVTLGSVSLQFRFCALESWQVRRACPTTR